MTHKAEKVVIITEKLILDRVLELLEDAGATGYTVTSAGGKGSRNVRSEARTTVAEAFSNVKIETILGDAAAAERQAREQRGQRAALQGLLDDRPDGGGAAHLAGLFPGGEPGEHDREDEGGDDHAADEKAQRRRLKLRDDTCQEFGQRFHRPSVPLSPRNCRNTTRRKPPR